LVIAAYLVRSHNDASEWPEVRDGDLTGDLVVREAHEDVAASAAQAEVAAPGAVLLIGSARRRFSVAPASRRAPQSNHLAESRAFAYGPGAAEDDLVVRPDPCIVSPRLIGSPVEC
jgi:hypothetical protein